MAKTAAEYKEELLRKVSGDAFLAEKDAAFLEREITYAETDGIADMLTEKKEEATVLGEFLRALAIAVEDVEPGF